MTCNHCGTQLPDGTAFCPNCGTRLLTTPRPNTAGRLRQQKQQEKQAKKSRQAPPAQQPFSSEPLRTPQPDEPSTELRMDDPAPKAKSAGKKWKWIVLIVLLVAVFAAGAITVKKLMDDRSGDTDGKKHKPSVSEDARRPEDDAKTPQDPQPSDDSPFASRASAERMRDACIDALNAESPDDLKDCWLIRDDFLDYFKADPANAQKLSECRATMDEGVLNANILNRYRSLQTVAFAYFKGQEAKVFDIDGTSATYVFPGGNETQLPLAADALTASGETFGVFDDVRIYTASTETLGDGNVATITITVVQKGNEWFAVSILPANLDSFNQAHFAGSDVEADTSTTGGESTEPASIADDVILG